MKTSPRNVSAPQGSSGSVFPCLAVGQLRICKRDLAALVAERFLAQQEDAQGQNRKGKQDSGSASVPGYL